MMIWVLLELFLLSGFAAVAKSQITTAVCGNTKACYLSPNPCTDGSDCEFFVSWSPDDDGNIVISMTGSGVSTYIAIGFSKSGIMRDSDVYACTSNLEVVRSRNTVGNVNEPKPLKGVSNVNITMIDGRIECSFTRQASINDGDVTYFDLSERNVYFIIMAKSSGILRPDGAILSHEAGVYDPQVYSFQNISLNDDGTLTSTTETSTVAMPTNDDKITSSGCGITKGCFRQPSDCSGGNDCDFFLSWTSNREGDIRFRMAGINAETYIALGFSKSGKMRNSDVYACTSNRKMVRSRNTDGNANDPTPKLKGVSDISLRIVNGRIECQFTRRGSLNDGDATYYDLTGNNTYYIIMAKSSGRLQNDGNISAHAVNERTAGTVPISFQTFTQLGGEVDELALILQKAHGSLMVVAWVLSTSLGITIARFYKDMWPNQKICTKPVWFVLHVTCMSFSLICTVVAFGIIFWQKGEFVKPAQDVAGRFRFLHAVLGTVVTFLVIVNPIMSIFRPHPYEGRRFIFNWAHWGVGTTAQLLGLTTICLGVGFRDARPLITGLPQYLFWVIVVFLAYHFAIWVLFQIQSCMEIRHIVTDNRAEGSTTQLEMENTEEQRVAKPLAFSTMMGLLAIYFIGALLTTGALVFAITTVGMEVKI